MTVKGICYELACAAGKILTGIGSAAAEVLSQCDLQEQEETDLERYTRETRDFYTKSPNGDGRNDLDPNGIRDSL